MAIFSKPMKFIIVGPRIVMSPVMVGLLRSSRVIV